MTITRCFIALGALAAIACPQPGRAEPAPQPAAASHRPLSPAATRSRINNWTVGLAGGLLEGAPIRLAAEIARVVDDGDNLHVLPIVTRGPTDNIESLLNLQGIDAAIINIDALEEFKAKVPNIESRISLLLSLFPSEMHVFVRPEIASIKDLAGKKVNFNTVGTAAAYTGPLVFDRLGLNVDRTFIAHQTALEQLRTGEIAAVVFLSSKPVDAFLKGKWEGGYHFVDIEYGDKLSDYYLPASLERSDYPGLIAEGTSVRTLSVPTVMVSYRWPSTSDRYRRVARMTDYLFDRLALLQKPGFHPKWQDVNLAARAGKLERFPAAQAWLDRQARTAPENGVARVQAARTQPNSVAEQERLFQEFLDWRRRR